MMLVHIVTVRADVVSGVSQQLLYILRGLNNTNEVLAIVNQHKVQTQLMFLD